MFVRAGLVALVALSACTAADGSGRRPADAGRPAPTVSADAELRGVIQDYFACLRDEGVEVDDPEFDASGRVRAWPSYASTDSVRSAEEACGDALNEIAFRPRGEAAIFLERANQFADCMAAEGVPGVEVSLEGIFIKGGLRSNREVRRAERTCRHFVEPPS